MKDFFSLVKKSCILRKKSFPTFGNNFFEEVDRRLTIKNKFLTASKLQQSCPRKTIFFETENILRAHRATMRMREASSHPVAQQR